MVENGAVLAGLSDSAGSKDAKAVPALGFLNGLGNERYCATLSSVSSYTDVFHREPFSFVAFLRRSDRCCLRWI